jgi:hypothetical protein
MRVQWLRDKHYDIIVDKSYAPWVAYPNPRVTYCLEGDCFMGTSLVPSQEMTSELWERALGLVVCGLATRYQSMWIAK